MDIAIGMIYDSTMDAQFVKCLLRLSRQRPYVKEILYCESGGGNLDKGRNVLVQKFLKSEYDWLLMLDTDQYFNPEDVDRLLESARERKAGVISGLYFANERPPRPAIYRWTEEGRAKSFTEWEDHEVIEVDGVGAGFLLVHRQVYEALNDPTQYAGRGGSWFTQNMTGPQGQLLNEDSSFCARVRDAGYKILVDTDVFIGHIKPRVLGFE